MIALIFICAILIIASFGLGVFRAMSELARKVQVNDVSRKLSIEIEVYRLEKGSYPHSLSELLTVDYGDESGKKASRELIGMTKHNSWNDTYDYVPSTNGFTIVVTGPESIPAGWFGKQRKVERRYKIGEVLK